MTDFGLTTKSFPVFFTPFSVIPQIGVISDPAYVVGIATIGREVFKAIAFARPMEDPPPTGTRLSIFSSQLIFRPSPLAHAEPRLHGYPRIGHLVNVRFS